jgi:hypothetical protein
MSKHIILAVHSTDRLTEVPTIQGLFSEYGRNIKTRLGLHEVGEGMDAPNGIILLEMHGAEARCDEMAAKLGAIEGVEVQKVVFEHA